MPAISSSHLCSACDAIFSPASYEPWQAYWNNLGDDEIDSIDNSWISGNVTSGGIGIHHRSEASLRQAIQEQCWLCLHLIPEDAPPFEWAQFKSGSKYKLRRGRDGLSDSFELEFSYSTYGVMSIPVTIVMPGDESFTRALQSKAQPWTGCTDIQQLAKAWFDACGSHHSCMHLAREKWNPTRLLEIQGDKVRLVEAQAGADYTDYASLSHCWGKAEFFRLTPSTKTQLLNGVSIDSFPLTFKEAFEVVQSLGMRYIWIDCYCIMQGDSDEARKDWSREVDKMRRVYLHSSVNIFAADSNGPFEGLFRHRNLQDAKTNFVQWQPMKDAPTSYFSLEGQRKTNADAFSLALESLEQEPLMKRGWVVQEMVLSRRMLCFTDNQVIWQCLQSGACEDAPSLTDQVPQNRSPSRAFWAFATQRQAESGKSSLTVPSLLTDWYSVMEIYSACKLSFPDKDIYNAIKGVGEFAAIMLNDACNYGMLYKSLPISLLWSTTSEDCQRSPPERAPSWHWASYEGGVSFHHCQDWHEGRPKTHGLAHIFWQTEAGSDDSWPLAICIGRPFAIRVERINAWEPGDYNSTVKVQLANSTIQIEAGIDRHGKACGVDGDFVYLPLLADDKEAQRYIQLFSALILRKSIDGKYQRVGLGCPDTWDDSMKLEHMISGRKAELMILE